MKFRFRSIHRRIILFLLTFVFFELGIAGEASKRESLSLLSRNPFSRVGIEVQEDPIPAFEISEELQDIVEFCGSYDFHGNRKFSLLFKKSAHQEWLEVDEPLYGVKVVQYLGDFDAIVVDYQGEQSRLDLRERSIQASRRKSNSSVVQRRKATPSSSFKRPSKSSNESVKPPRTTPLRIPKPKGMGEAPKPNRV